MHKLFSKSINFIKVKKFFSDKIFEKKSINRGEKMEVQKIESMQSYGQHKLSITIDSKSSKNEHKKKIDIEIDNEKLKDFENKVNNVTTSLNFQIEFQVHKDSKRIFVKIVDKKTKKVIREIPPEQLLEFYANFEKMLGVLFNRKS